MGNYLPPELIEHNSINICCPYFKHSDRYIHSSNFLKLKNLPRMQPLVIEIHFDDCASFVKVNQSFVSSFQDGPSVVDPGG